MSRKSKKRIKTEFVDDDLESDEIDVRLANKLFRKYKRKKR